MKKLITAALLLLSLHFFGQTKHVLFLGNSYTNVNNLPQLTADVATSVDDSLLFYSITPGGYTLQGHSTNNTSLEKIMQGIWDFVILQEQSQRPALPINQVEENVFPYARFLDSVINVYNPCGETMFYRTWGRKNGDSYYCPTWPPVCTYEGMDSLLHLRYMMMAASNEAVVSPVGEVWKYIRESYPEIDLYQLDESHPSAEGSYAAACCFYTAIFRKDPSLISYNFTIDPLFASNIRTATKLVVYDNLINWHIGEYDLISEFNYEHLNGLTYQFTNLSQNATGQTWDFGSDTDTISNPIFTFPDAGFYTVQLISYDQCDTVVSSEEIFVSPTMVTKVNPLEALYIYPNPAQNHICFNLNLEEKTTVDFYNCLGKNVLSFNSISDNKLDILDLSNGLYYIEIKTNEFRIIKKLLKK